MASDHDQEQSNSLEAEILLKMDSLARQTASFAEQVDALIASLGDISKEAGAVDIVGRRLEAMVDRIKGMSSSINGVETASDDSPAVFLARKMEALQQTLTDKVRMLLDIQFTELAKALNELQAVPVSFGNDAVDIQLGGYPQSGRDSLGPQRKPEYRSGELNTAVKILADQSQKLMSAVMSAMQNILGDSYDSGASLLLSMGYEANKAFEYQMAQAASNFKGGGIPNSAEKPVQTMAVAYGLPVEDAAAAYRYASTAASDPLEAQHIAAQAAKLINIGGMDIQQSASGLAFMATKWGLNAAGVEDAANMMVAGSKLAFTQISDLLEMQKSVNIVPAFIGSDEDKRQTMADSIAVSSMYPSTLSRTGNPEGMFFMNMLAPLDDPASKKFEEMSQRTGFKTLDPWSGSQDVNGEREKPQKSGMDMLFAVTDVMDRLDANDRGYVQQTYASKLGNDSVAVMALLEDMARVNKAPSVQAEGGAAKFAEKLQDKQWTAGQSNQMLTEHMLTYEFQEQKLQTMWEVSTQGIFDHLKEEFQTVSSRVIAFLDVIRSHVGNSSEEITSLGKGGQGFAAQQAPKADLQKTITAVQKRLDLVNSKRSVLSVGHINDKLGTQREEYEQLKLQRAEIENSGKYGSEAHMDVNRRMNKKQWDIDQTRRSLVWAQSVDPRLDLEAQHLERTLTMLIRQMKEMERQADFVNTRMELLDTAMRVDRLDGDLLVNTIARVSGGFVSGTMNAQKFEEELRHVSSSAGHSDQRIKQFINDMVQLNKEFQDTGDIQKYINALARLEHATRMQDLEITHKQATGAESKPVSENKEKDKEKDKDKDKKSAYEIAKEIREFFTDDWYKDKDEDSANGADGDDRTDRRSGSGGSDEEDSGGRRSGSSASDEEDSGSRRSGSGGSDEDDSGDRRSGSSGSDEDDNGSRRSGSGGSDGDDSGGRRSGSSDSDEDDNGGRRSGSGDSNRGNRRGRRSGSGGGRRGIGAKLAGLTRGAGKLFSKAGKFGKLASTVGKGLKIGLKKVPLISAVETGMDFYSDVVAPLSMTKEERAKQDASGRVDLQKKAQAIGDGNFLTKAFGIGEMILDGGIRGGINQIFGGTGVKWTEYADALKISFSGKKGKDLTKALEQKFKGNADSEKVTKKVEEKPKKSDNPLDSNGDSKKGDIDYSDRNQAVRYEDAQSMMSRTMSLQQNETAKIQATHDESYAKLVMSGVREDSAEMRALFETYFKKNIEMLDGILNGTKNADGKIMDEGLIAKRDRQPVGSDSYNEIDAQIANIQGQISSLKLQDYQMSADGEFNDIMGQFNHDLKISNADWSMKRSDAILSGAREDSNGVKQIQNSMAQDINSRIGITLGDLHALLDKNKDNETQRNKILEQIKELEVQQKNNLVDIKNSLLQGKSTFNLPDGVQAMSYYEMKVSEGTAKQVSFGSGDVNVTIQANVNGQQDWTAVGNQVAGIVKNVNVNVSRELSQQVKTGMQYNHR